MSMHITHASVLTGLNLSDHKSCTVFLLKCCQSPRLGARVQKMHRALDKAHGNGGPLAASWRGVVADCALWVPAHRAILHDETTASYISASHLGVSVYPACL